MGILEEMRDILQKSGKAVTLMASLLVVLGLAVGGTVAILFDKTEAITNTFTPAEITTTVDEGTDKGVKSNVKIKNEGTTDAWIRAAVIITWQNEAGEVYGKAPVADTDYTITYDLANGWVKGNDGFYYYTSPVAAGKSTGELITKCELKDGANVPTGYNLCVEILGSAIQSWPLEVFNNTSTQSPSGSGWSASSGLRASGDQSSQSLSSN